MKLSRLLSSSAHICVLFTLLTCLPATAWAQDVSPTPSPRAPMPPPPTITVTPERATSGGRVDVLVQGVRGQVELYAGDNVEGPFARIRVGEALGGSVAWAVFPDRHKTLYAKQTDEGTANGGMSSKVAVGVTAALSIDARRFGTRSYSFYGQVRPYPASAGALVSLYRVDPASGRAILTAQARPSDSGLYDIRRLFTGSGRFGFFSVVGATAAADSGRSRTRPTVIH